MVRISKNQLSQIDFSIQIYWSKNSMEQITKTQPLYWNFKKYSNQLYKILIIWKSMRNPRLNWFNVVCRHFTKKITLNFQAYFPKSMGQMDTAYSIFYPFFGYNLIFYNTIVSLLSTDLLYVWIKYNFIQLRWRLSQFEGMF